MELTFQSLFNIAIAVISFGLGFIVNRLFSKLDALTEQDAKLTAEIHGVRVMLPTNYVTKHDMETIADMIFTKLDNIVNKLDKKMDKA